MSIMESSWHVMMRLQVSNSLAPFMSLATASSAAQDAAAGTSMTAHATGAEAPGGHEAATADSAPAEAVEG